jgi:AcrR family transcriptional regulator
MKAKVIDIDAKPAKVSGPRAASAARRRQNTRDKLLDATMQVCAERGRAVIIEDVLRAADISRATFYSHFQSLHDAVATVGKRLADEASQEHCTMYADVSNPILRLAVGPQLILMRATLDPTWGATFVQSDEFFSNSAFVSAIRVDVAAAMRAGVIRRTDLDAAVDLHLGAQLMGARTLQSRKRGRATYIRAVALNLLLAFGTAESTALEAIEWTAKDISERAPQFLPWWRELR